MISNFSRLLGIISVRENDTHIIISGIPGLRFTKDVYNAWKTSKVSNNLFSSVSRSVVKFPKFYAIEVLYILETLMQSRRTFTGRRTLEKVADELVKNTWLHNIGGKDFKGRLDYKMLDDLNVTLFTYQRKFLENYDYTTFQYDLQGMLMDVAAGGGKAQPLYSKIKVPGGWATMGDMQIGTEVVAPDGTITKVTGVYPQGKRDVYEVEFWDGRITRACGEHLWESFDGTVRDPHRWAVRDTLEMKRLLEKNRQRLYIPLVEAEDSASIEVPVDPYLLGALLGDGGLRYNLRFSTPDLEIVDHISATLTEGLNIRHVDEYDYVITDACNNKNSLTDEIRKLGLFGKYSFEKFVPALYMNGSKEQRLEILRGLMDTDGTVNDHGVVSFTSTSQQLAEDVQYLIRSLGGIARISIKEARYTYNGEVHCGRTAYNVNIRYKKPSELFSLTRKKMRCKDDGQYAEKLKLRVRDIRLIGSEDVQCISVDHPRHLYVTDDFIVTHNTITQYALAHTLRADTRVYIAPKNSIIDVWVRTIKMLFKSEQTYWHSLSGTEPEIGKAHYIVHFDYLEKFLAFVKANKGKFGQVYVGIDESHNFNEQSARTNFLIDICTVMNARDVIHASGTPFKAMGSEAITLLKTVCKDFSKEVEASFRKLFGKEAKKALEILANRIGIVSFKVVKEEVETPGVDYFERQIKIKNGQEYTLTSVRDKMTKFIGDRLEMYKSHMPVHEKLYKTCMELHEKTLKSSQNISAFRLYRNYVDLIRKGYDPVTMKDMVMYCNRYELKEIVPSLPEAYRKPFLNVRAIIKYVDLKVMGEALSQVLGRLRIQCHLDMLPNIPFDEFIDNSKSKTVIFTSYVEVVKDLEKLLTAAGYKPLVVYGDTNKELPTIVKKFEGDEDANPLIATFKSLSTAVPLTMASTEVFTNSPFREYERTQAVARVDRVGQAHRCSVFETFLDTAGDPNISTRSKDILSWSRDQVAAILGVQVPDNLETSLESLVENPASTIDDAESFMGRLIEMLPVDSIPKDMSED